MLYSDISDHLPIFTVENTLMQNKAQKADRTVRKFTDENVIALRNNLNRVNWSNILSINDDVDKAYCVLYDEIESHLNESIPCITIKSNHRNTRRNPWITKGILRSINTKNRLYKKCVKHPKSSSRWAKYKRYRNKSNTIIKLSRQRYFDDNFRKVKGDTSYTWRVINDLIGKK